MIAVLVFVAYSILGELHLGIALGFTLLLLIATPWIIVRALKFRLGNTSYRNVRFGFESDYRGALREFVLWPLALLPSLGLLWPWIRYRQHRYVVNNMRYGTSRFRFEGSARPWIMAGLPLVVIVVGGGVLPALYSGIIVARASSQGEPTEEYPDGEPIVDEALLGVFVLVADHPGDLDDLRRLISGVVATAQTE